MKICTGFIAFFTIGMALTLLIRLSPRGLDYAGYFGGRRYTSHGLTGALYVAAVGEAIFYLVAAARKVTEGDFSVQAKLEDKAPEELLTLTHDFNEMTKN